jgi:hypothetical protein
METDFSRSYRGRNHLRSDGAVHDNREVACQLVFDMLRCVPRPHERQRDEPAPQIAFDPRGIHIKMRP